MLCPLAELYLSGGLQDTKSPCHLISDAQEQLYLASVFTLVVVVVGGGWGELDWWHNNSCLSVCAHACFGNDLKFIAPRPPGSFRAPQTKSASDHTDMSFGVPNFCSPTANQWSVPRIHSHLDHAHTHDRARPPIPPHLSFTVQRWRNSQHMFGKMNVLQRGQTVTQCTTLGSFG